MSISEKLLTPIGRLVQGSLYEGQTTDAENRPLVHSNGPKKGEAYKKWFFVIAIPKGPEKHWNETEWGKKIWGVGQSAFPNGQANSPTFAWKVKDGDSNIPNKRGNKLCDQEGFPGNWCLNFTGTYKPVVVNADGSQVLTEDNLVNLGDYIQVFGFIIDNKSQQQPGIFLNHSHVALAGYGKRIYRSIDPKSVGFGGFPLPPGASSVPQEQGFNPDKTNQDIPPVPTSSSPVEPAPYRDILNVPAAPPVVRKMTAAAEGIPYEKWIEKGWNDQTLIQHGKMEP